MDNAEAGNWAKGHFAERTKLVDSVLDVGVEGGGEL